jgi:hypothetical protein
MPSISRASLFVCIASLLGYTFARVPGSRAFDSASVQFAKLLILTIPAVAALLTRSRQLLLFAPDPRPIIY